MKQLIKYVLLVVT